MLRPRRSTLAVPGSSTRMLAKAKTLPVDEVFMDLEDAVAPIAKAAARKNIVAALNEGGYEGKIRAVRVNDWTTHWTYRDVIEVVENAGANLDCIMLPKVQTAEQVVALDLLLTQIENGVGLEVGRIGIEAQIENALGLVNVDAIAAASPRVEAIIFGPADFMASINMKSLVVGEQPPGYQTGDAYHYILMRILMAARAYDKQAIDGPYLQISDLDGYRRVAQSSAALGFDGKWVLHPSQIEAAEALGLSTFQIYRDIILRPALERVYPSLTSQFTLMMLQSSITSQISAEELTGAANVIQSITFRSMEAYLVVGLLYLLLTLLLKSGFWALGQVLFPRRRRLGTAL